MNTEEQWDVMGLIFVMHISDYEIFCMKKIAIASVLILLVFNVLAQPKSEFEILIDNGNTYATKRNVNLLLRSSYKYQMKISNRPDFAGAEWIAYKNSFTDWILTGNEGVVEVFAKFRNEKGEESQTVSDKIILDLTPPENTQIIIDVPNKITNDKNLKVRLLIKASDAEFMMLSNSSNFYGRGWEKFREEYKDWQLEPGEGGYRYVYAKFKDKAQNISPIVYDRILYDIEKPLNGGILIDNDRTYTTNQNRTVELRLSSTGADSMIISQLRDFSDAVWLPFKPNLTFKLNEGDGEKTVFVKFKDAAGNETDVYSDKIIMDLTPPTDCSVTINDGATETTDINKKVKLTCKADPDTEFMLISNKPNFGNDQWTIYRPEVTDWVLAGEKDELKTVYVKFKDKAGNISAVFKASIELKRGFND